jgi:hypothetical protein
MVDIPSVADDGRFPKDDDPSSTNVNVPLAVHRDDNNDNAEEKLDANFADNNDTDDNDMVDVATKVLILFMFVPAPSNNIITLTTILDTTVFNMYLADILHFPFFCHQHEQYSNCLTGTYIQILTSSRATYPHQEVHYIVSKSSNNSNLFFIIVKMCLLFFVIVLSLTLSCHPFSHSYQKGYSKCFNNLKKSVIAHLFRCHNCFGFTEVEMKLLINMCNGYFNMLSN